MVLRWAATSRQGCLGATAPELGGKTDAAEQVIDQPEARRMSENGLVSSVDESNTEASWLRTPPTNTREIASRYDEWAPSYEDELVTAWRYDAPFIAARMVAESLHGSGTESVLDLGCGTGLVGRALAGGEIRSIDGVDVSEASLRAALSTGFYRRTILYDFNSGPLPFEAHSYDAAIAVGVLSYALDPIAVIRELRRVVVPRGVLVFTHRTDLWDRQHLEAELKALLESGEIHSLTWSDPKPYMPGNPSEGDLRIRYVSIT